MEYTLRLSLTESELIRACVGQEKWAQQMLYENNYGALMAVCMRYSRTEDEALDLLHEGFIKIFTQLHKYQPETALSAWMKRVVINNCIDHYRRQSRFRTAEIDEAVHLQSPEADAISQYSEKEILDSIRKLSPAYRTIFNLYVIEGFSHKEIGEKMNITESTSRSNLVKARIKLKNFLLGNT